MLRIAHRDLAALQGMADSAVFADEIFGFHAQQAIEKCLKAWMCALGLSYPFTHHINRLLVLLRDAGADVEELWWTDEFTLFAHQARYEEGHMEADAPLERQTISTQISQLLSRVESTVSALP
ncbi:MAG: HEPN domain-containing protein [Rhodoferax sp.]|nr:HEPN domain-containing protein [Rhodoferax sp.]